MPTSTLWEVANMALMVLGFTGVVAYLGKRAQGEWTQGDRRRVGQMIIATLRLLFASLLPLILIYFELPDKVVWMTSSALCLLVFIGVGIWTLQFVRQKDGDSSRVAHHTIRWLLGLSMFVCLLNAVGVLFEPFFGPYFLVLMMNLFVAIILFVRLFQTGMFGDQ